MKKERVTSGTAYNCDGLISRMYRISGGCLSGRTCSECRQYEESEDIHGYTCKLHGGGCYWKGSWTACRIFEEKKIHKVRKKADASVKAEKKRKPEGIKMTEEVSGQMRFM